MVAVVSGSGLGLFGTTGGLGSPATGRAGERVFVNTATGNLVIQGVDETLVARGLDLALVRTYNSQGLLNDDNGDNWRLGIQRRVYGLSGPVNTAGSTITKVFGDAAEVVYTYDVVSGRYVSTDGDGAHDTLAFANNEWTWTDGSSRSTETYDSQGRLSASRDADGNLVSYIYTGAHLTQIVDASGQQTFLDYTGNNLQQVRVVSDGATQTLTRYAYDGQGRLGTVTLDITPEDNATTDNNVYVTTYTYEGNSHRVASVTQTDGSSCAFTYQLIDGEYRVHTYTDGEGRVTTFDYSQASGAGGGNTPVSADANPAVLSTTESSTSSIDLNINNGSLVTTDTQTTTDTYNLNTGALTTSAGGASWSLPAGFDMPADMAAGDPKVAFDANGNGMVVWSHVFPDGTAELVAQRYTRATNSWGAVQSLAVNLDLTDGPVPSSLAVDASGNALVAYSAASFGGPPYWVSARRYDAATATWGAAITLGQGSVPVAAINGTFAAVTWSVSSGGHLDLMTSRLSGGNWLAAMAMESSTTNVGDYSMAMDDQGNINVVFTQGSAVNRNRYTASSNTWSGPVSLAAAASTRVQVALDGAGNGFATWTQGTDLMMSRYTRSTNTWSAASALDSLATSVGTQTLAVDTAGNALVSWTQSDGVAVSVYARRYNAATSAWSAATALESSAGPATGKLSVAINGSYAAVEWILQHGSNYTAYGATFNGTAWSSPAQFGATSPAAGTAIAMDSLGNAMAFWQLGDGSADLYISRFSNGLPAGGAWNLASLIEAEPAGTTATAPQVAYDSNGNGFAIWVVTRTTPANVTIKAARYTRSTNTWAAPTSLYNVASTAVPTASLSVDAGGNAMVAWIVGGQMFAVRYTGTWGSVMTVGTASGAAGGPIIAMNGNIAAIVWQEGPMISRTQWVSRWNGTAWTAKASISQPNAMLFDQSVAVDNQGNISVAFTQYIANSTMNILYVNRYTASSNTWSGLIGVAAATADLPAPVHPQIALDSSGNGVMVWAQGGDLRMARYTRSTNSWNTAISLDNLGGAVTLPSLALDAAGNALVAWTQVDETDGVASAFSKIYNATTASWGAVTLLDNQTQPVNVSSLRTAVNGSFATVVWTQTDGTRDNLYTARYNGTAWSAVTQIETNINNATSPSVALDSLGNAHLFWQQSDGTTTSVYQTRYTVGGTPTYTVPAGATWQSVANALYGINSAAAGTALQTAMGNPPLTAGAQIPGWPATLSVNTVVPVPPYYLVPGTPATPTWRSIAAVVYGVDSPEAGAALQALMGSAYPTLSVGLHLSNLPALLHVETTVTTTVPAYYVVTSTDWADVTDAVYGTRDPAAIAALQQATGFTTLTAGQHLPVPLTLNYTIVGGGGTSTTYLRTDIEDALGFVTTLTQDSAGRLTAMESPAVNGTRFETDYTYDLDGNVTTVTQDPDGLNRTSTFEYDGRGNVTLSRDSAGNTVTRTYSATNQLLTETRYLVPDPDGAGTGAATAPITSRFVYDAEDHLRFSISAAGRVVEHRYDASGQRTATLQYGADTYSGATFSLTNLTSWAATQDLTDLQRIDYAYDFRGNVSSTTQFAATDAAGAGVGTASVTRFVYDQHGRLLTTIGALGELTPGISTDHLTSYTYDGLGRVLNVTEWVSGSSQRTTLNSYDDANRRTRVTLESGLITTSQFNTAGELVTITQGVAGDLDSLGTTSFSYDDDGRLRMVTDAAGARSFSFYDEAGRLVGQVDADGTLTESVYDGASAVVKTVQYAVRLDATTLASLVNAGVPQDVSLATLRDAADGVPASDRITRSVYDAAGRIVFSIDADGALTQFFYDGAGRLTDEMRFATRVAVAASAGALDVATVQPLIVSTPEDRRTRHFYDADGNETGTLDSAGYLVEYLRDPAGFLLQQIGYATRTAAQYWNAGTLEQLRPAASDEDIRSRFFHDGQGRQIGTLDAEGYLSETVYDVAGHVVSTTRYDVALDYVEGTSTFGSLRNEALASADLVKRTSTFTYDGLGRVTSSTDFEGVISTLEYDEAGNLIRSTRAVATTEARTAEMRYDELGRVTQQLTAEGSALITTGMSQAAINDIWSRYGVSYAYDIAGRRISATVRPNSSQTNTTLYFYDEEGRLRFEVNPLGEVRETRYDAFGQASESLAYVNRISTATLVGGAIVQTLLDRLVLAADVTRDSHTLAAYTRRGQLASTATSESNNVSYEYNAFGDNTARTQLIEAGRNLRHEYGYDTRGQLTLTRWDPTGFNTTETRTYDAFGRTIGVTDARGATSEFEFDRLGRQIVATDALSVSSSAVYDAFSRTRTTTDGLGNVTTYHYDDATRTMTLTTPEGVSIETTHNRHGQTLRVVAAGRTTQSVYDLNGNLLETFDNLGSFGTTAYDRAGRAFLLTGTSGVTTTVVYDAANRVLTSTVASTGDDLALVTQYVYDGEGRVTQVTEPGGRVTATEYDRDGRVSAVTIDPAGLNLRTQYFYDHSNNLVETIEGQGSLNPRRTVTAFDNLGRRISDTVDPDTGNLNLVTQYRYDANNNLARKIDAEGHSTWYVYDAVNQLRFSVDALGGVSEMTYDAAGRVIATRRYATPVDLEAAAFSDIVTTTQLSSLLETTALDHVSQSVFSGDGLEIFTVNGLGGVTERTFDENGNVTRTRLYANAVATGVYLNAEDLIDALEAADNDIAVLGDADRVAWTAYDLRGRAAFAVDGLGAVTQTQYDNRGNVITSTAFATLRDVSQPMTLAALQSWATGAASNTHNRVTRFWYDALDRVRFSLDAEGYLAETSYDDNARIERSIRYAAAPPVIAINATLDAVEIVATALRNTSADIYTETRHDVAGRVTRVYDAANNYEEYGYDAVGNKTSLRNKKGDVWTYEYDANHRLITERSPQVTITRLQQVWVEEPTEGYVLQAMQESASVVTSMAYSALGNVISRTEAVGLPGERTTTYEYDALGRQIITRFPEVGVYDGEDVPVVYFDYGILRDRSEFETQMSLFTETTYDTLGNAISNIDVGGGFTHNFYDSLGRLRFKVDAEGGVTEFRYDTFGNQTELIRYAESVSLDDVEPADLTLANIEDWVYHAEGRDRTISTEYDRMNRAVRVTQPEVFVFDPSAGVPGGQYYSARPTTVSQYDAFGQAIKQSRLVNPSTNLWAETYSYFDERGQQTAQIDELGYVTEFAFDAYGNTVRSVEYAKGLATGSWSVTGYAVPIATNATNSPNDPAGYDRVTELEYDSRNRLVAERRVGVAYSSASSAGVAAHVADNVTSYGYDALGNQTRVTDAAGAATYTYYDVLGRQIAIAAPSRDIGNTTVLTPLVVMDRDAFGNMVRQTIHAFGAQTATETAFTPRIHDDDRQTLFVVDSHNRTTRTLDDVGADKYVSYTARGDIGREWQPLAGTGWWSGTASGPVTAYTYDRVGRQTSATSAVDTSSGNNYGTIKYTTTGYNTFGEIESQFVLKENDNQEVASTTLVDEYYVYDQGGRLISSNAGDAVQRVYLYDLAGHRTAEIRSATSDLRYVWPGEAAQVRTETRYDIAGRVVEQRQPGFEVVNDNQGLQNIGGILRVGNAVLAPNNPAAIYRVTTQTTDYGYGDINEYEVAVIDVEATPANGGGYQYVPPTSANPAGGWVVDPNYALVAKRVIHWSRPPGYTAGYGINTGATFEWRSGSSGAWTSANIILLPRDEIGVDLSNFTNGNYEYRLTYRRPNSTEPYALATGTLTVGASTSLADTTAASIAGGSQTVTSVVTEVAQNVQFRDAALRIGDFNAPASIDGFVYKRTVVNGAPNYTVDRTATVGQGGGYYRTTPTTFVQMSGYTPANSRLIQWNAPSDPGLQVLFEYEAIGGQGRSGSLTPVLLPGGVYSIAIGSLPDGEYQFSVVYRLASNPSAGPVATATGIFRLEPAVVDDSMTLTPDLADDAGLIAPITNRPAGAMNITSSIVASSVFDEANAQGVLYTGLNDVLLTFADISGPVRVELEYLTDVVEASQDPGSNGTGWPSESRRISVSLANGSNAASGVNIRWSDPGTTISSGGISQIVAVRVYSVSGGASTLRYSTNAADLATMGGTTIAWKAPWSTSITPTFRISPAGTNAWQERGVTRVAGDFVVDLAGLEQGQWDYDIRYTQNGVTRALSSGTLTTGGGAILNTFETPPGGVYPIEAVAPVTGMATGAVDFTVVNSAVHTVQGMPALDEPLSFHWDETNQVNLTWADLGTGNVRVVIDYTSAQRYAYNYATSGTPGWQGTAEFVPGVVTSHEETFTSGGATGVTLDWDDADTSLIGGIQTLHRVRVYTQVGGNWVLRLDRDAAAPRGGQSIYWDAADDPGVTTDFRVRVVGTSTWTDLDVTAGAGGLELVNIDQLTTSGDYEYQIIRSRNSGGGDLVIALASGRFTVSSNAQTHNLSLTQNNVTFGQGTNDFGPVAWDSELLSWTQPRASGDTITVRWREAGTSTWTSGNVTGSGPDFTFAVVPQNDEVLEFEVLYFHSGESAAYVRAGGRLNVEVATTTVAPLITVTQTVDTQTPFIPITGFYAVDGQLAWVAEVDPLDIEQVRIMPVGGNWVTRSFEVTDSGYVVDLSDLSDGEYRYEVSYWRSGQSLPRAFASGTVVVGSGAQGAGMSLLDTTEYVQSVISETNPTTPTQLQTLDRWGNVLSATDVSGNTTIYRYNQVNALVETQLPEVAVVDTTGGTVQSSVAHPVLESHFDLLGRLVATTDGKGNVNRAEYNVAGDLLKEIAADGGQKSRVYNGFGEVWVSTDQLGYRTLNTYDHGGRLTSVQREVVQGGLGNTDPAYKVTTSYAYDQRGNRVSEVNDLGEQTRYSYYTTGELRGVTTNRGFQTQYQYDLLGRKIRERDAIGLEQRWTYGLNGRLAAQTDLNGTITTYRYDRLGSLTYQTSTLGQRQQFFYDKAGHLLRIVDTGAPSQFADVVGVNRISTYGYDIAGRRVAERVVVDGRVHQDSYTTFDALGRILRVNDPDYEVNYSYDAAGNRTHIAANYFNHIGIGTGYVQTQDLWYTYDEMNRVKISQGMNAAGSIVFNTAQGIDLTYNLKGERTSARTNGEHLRVTQTLFNGAVTSTQYHRVTSGLFTEQYSYDGLGRLIATDIVADRTATEIGTGGVISGTWLVRMNTREYDAASREVKSFSYSIDEEESNVVQLDELRTETAYDDDGRTAVQATFKNGVRTSRVVFGDATYKEEEVVAVTSETFLAHIWVAAGSRSGKSGQSSKPAAVPGNNAVRVIPAHWEGNGWDSAGNLIGYTVEYYKETNGKFTYSTTHQFDYRRAQGYQLIGERTQSTKKGPSKGSTTRTYNVNGELVQYSDSKDKSKNRYFANDAQGRALTVVNGKFDGQDGRLTATRAFDNALTRTGNKVKAQYFFFANGENIGTFGQLVNEDGLIKANFDVNYTPVSSNYPASTPSQVSAQQGDTLRSIAARVFGDASLWYVIAEANGLTDPDAALEAGQPIDIPNKVLSLSNDAQSFKPYDASLALGDTTPTQPFPKGGCGVLGTLVLAVIAVVVAFYTAGAASSALASVFGGSVTSGSALVGTLEVSIGGTFSAGASTAIGIGAAMAGGAAASAVTQGLSILTGYQDSFSWKGVAMGAIGAGVTSGLGFLGQTDILSGVLGNPAGNAVVNNMLTQGIGVATKMQDSFSWRDVAISAAAATGAHFAGKWTAGKTPGATREFLGRVASGAAGSAVRMAFNGKVDVATVLADAFGSALGDSIVGQMSPGAGAGGGWEKWRENRAAAAGAQEAARQSRLDALANEAAAAAQVTEQDLASNPDVVLNLDVTHPTEDETRQGLAQFGGVDRTATVSAPEGPELTELPLLEQKPAAPRVSNSRLRANAAIDRWWDDAISQMRDTSLDQAASQAMDKLFYDALTAPPKWDPRAHIAEFREMGRPVAPQSGVEIAAETSRNLYVEQGFAKNSWDIANAEASDPNNPWYTRAAFLGLGAAATGVMLAEEFTRSLLNIPSGFAGAPVLADQADKALATVFSSESTFDDRVIGGLGAVRDYSFATLGILGPLSLRGGEFSAGAQMSERVGPLADDLPIDNFVGPTIDRKVLFGQKRVSPAFSPVDEFGRGPPPHLAGREISDVAADLVAGRLHPDQLPIQAFIYKNRLVSANTRSLAALSEAGMQPTKISIIQPTRDLIKRVRENPIIRNAPLPGPRVPVTPSISNPRVIRVIELPGGG